MNVCRMMDSYAVNASASEPSMTAFSAMPSVRTIICLKTLSLAAAAWFECWTWSDPLIYSVSILERLEMFLSASTYFDEARIFVLAPPGHSTTWKPAPSGTLNVESWSS
jgi:hypothetical protein